LTNREEERYFDDEGGIRGELDSGYAEQGQSWAEMICGFE
jgi:hypothetical protein